MLRLFFLCTLLYKNALAYLPVYQNLIDLNDLGPALQISRRQQYRPGMIGQPQRPGSKKRTGKDDDYYEPYWENGDWVFYRHGSTNKPRGYILNTGSTQHSECNQICLKNYQDYGPVCGIRMVNNTWKYEFQTFDNMCYLELANCVSATKSWFLVRKGNCTKGDFTPHPTGAAALHSRKYVWEKNFPDK